MCFVVVVESGGVGENGTTTEYSDFILCLFCRGEDAEDAFAAWDGDSFAFELGDYVARLGGWGGGVAGYGHFG